MTRNVLYIIIYFLSFQNVFAEGIKDITFPKAERINEFTTRIPFKLVDHLIVVEAQLLNKKGNFIIDTGSYSLILNKVHFRSFYQHYKVGKRTHGVNGTIDNPENKSLNEFVLQNFKLKDLNSDIIDLSHIEKSKKMNLLGIIGFNILKDFEVFIDLHLNQITLTKVDKYGNKLDDSVYLEKIVDSVNFKLIKHTIVLNGYVQNQKVKFGLDTGAEFNQINKNINKQVLKNFRPKKKLKLVGASNKKIEVLLGKLYRFKLSETVYFGPMYTTITNLSLMNQAYGTKLDGVLGYEFFRQKRTIINYQKEKLYFINYPKYNLEK